MLPGADIANQDGSTGVAPQSDPEGIVAFIAASRGGNLALNTPAMYTDWSTAHTDAGDGPLPELAAYQLDVTGLPFILVRVQGSAGIYGAFAQTKQGTSVPSSGATEPVDSFDVLVVYPVGGTIGADDGKTYRVSLTGDPNDLGPAIALGTANSLVIPSTGITVQLGAGTVVAGDQFEFTTTGPRVLQGDLAAALAALAASDLPWEAVLIDGDANDTMIAAVDVFIRGLEAVGEYKVGALNTRYKNIAASESEQAYAASLAQLRAVSSSTRITLASDASDVISPIRNIFMRRPAQLGVTAREMSVDFAQMASVPGDGPLADVRITTPSGAPKYHNEQKNPGLDDMGFSTLRTIPRRSGAYNTLTRLWSALGSDWVFWPHARVMNLAKSIAWDKLSAQTSIGVHVRPNPQTPTVKNITEADAQKIEGLVQAQYDTDIVGKRASSASFALSRSDNLASNGPQTLTFTIQVGALRYVGKYKGVSKFI